MYFYNVEVNGAYGGQPMYVDVYNGTGWVHQIQLNTDKNGCMTVNLEPALQRYYWRFSVQYTPGGNLWYSGASGYAQVLGPYAYTLGTFWV